MPHDLEAEKCVLGAILVENAAYLVASQLLDAGDFFRVGHQRIYNAIGRLLNRDVAADFITLNNELARNGDLDEAGGASYISALTDGVPRAANVEHYARLVREDATRRRVIQEATQIQAEAYSRGQSGIATIESALHRLGTIGTAADLANLRQPVMGGAEAVEQWASMPAISERVLPLGIIPAIDQQMRGGLEPGECLFNLARPGSLKTMLVLNILRRWLARRSDEFFVLAELEMPRRQLIERLARMYFQLPSDVLDARRRSVVLDVDAFKRAMAGLCVIDDVGLSLRDVEQRIKLAQRQMQPDRVLGGVVIDHCGLVRASQGTSAYDRATETAIGIKQLARRMETPVLAIVQANRTAAATSRGGDPPEMEQARDSGAYEENADFMLSMSAIQNTNGNQYVTVKLVKNRRGAPWITQVGFDPHSLRMAELTDDGASYAA